MLLAVVVIAFPRAVLAKDVTIAVYVEGADAAAIRNTLLVNVPSGTTVAEADTFSAALAKHGQKVPFGKSLEGDARDRTVGKVRTALAASGLDGAVIARVIKEKTQRLVKLVYVGAGRNDAAKSDEVSLAPKRSKDDSGKLKTFLDSALASAEPEASPAAAAKPAAADKAAEPAAAAAAPATAPEANSSTGSEPAPAPAPSSPDSTSSRPRGTVGKNLFEVEVGAEGAGRNFTYNQNIQGSLREFSAFPMAMLAVSAEGYPFADSSGFVKDLGVTGSYSRSLFLTSAVASGPNIDTTESSYFVGLRYRIHPTGDPGLIIGIADGYAAQSVDFGTTTKALEAELPASDCSGNRLAVDARIPVGKLAIRAGFGWRAIFATGVIGERFKGTSAGGVDAQVGASYEVARGWEVRAIADYERYFYAFKPVPGDTYVAGGALDQFYGGRLALAYVY